MTKMMTKMVLALTAGLAIAATPASAATIAFDYAGGSCSGGTGTGTCMSLDSFDWLQGNSILISTGVNTGIVLYQANLDSGVSPTTPAGDFKNGTGSNYYTAIAAFSVTFTSAGVFTTDPGGTLEILHNTTGPGNDLAGTGFLAGNVVLSATTISGLGTFVVATPFLDPITGACLANCPQPIDQFNADDYPNYLTLAGVGGSFQIATVGFAADAFFPTLVDGSSLAFNNTSLIDPYLQINPSGEFWDGFFGGVHATCGTGQLGTAASPCINGTGPNIMAQADANTSFITNTVSVPEPASMVLLGTGLIGLAGRRRSRKASQAN